MEAWQALSEHERQTVWDRFYEAFSFYPSVHANHWPGIVEPQPSITYGITHYYYPGEGHQPPELQETARAIEQDLYSKTLRAFQRCLAPGQPLYALEWQSTGYWFHPHIPFIPGTPYNPDPDAWFVPVLPNGDYYIFLAEDFTFGIFGHPWEQTICIFGQRLIDAFILNQPLLFTRIIRVNAVGG